MSSGIHKQPRPPETRQALESVLDLLHLSDRKTLEQIATNVTHELNQPLTALLAYLQACLRLLESNAGNPGVDIPAMLRKAISEVHRADSIMTRLRDYVETSQGYKTSVDPNSIVRSACRLVGTDAANDGIVPVCELQPDLPPVLVETNQILLVLINLLQNSLQALKRSVTRKILLRSAMFGDDQIEITVQDTGPGMNPEILQNHLLSTAEGKQGSMGIGLTLCKSIINEHGGRLWIERSPEGGAAVHFTLPVTAGSP